MVVHDVLDCIKRTVKRYDFLAVLLACFLWPFWRFKSLEFSGDASFLWYLHEAFHRDLKYGSDISITTGPWAILNYSVFHPQTYLLVLSMQTLISVLLTLALLHVIKLSNVRIEYRCLIAVIFVAALSLSIDARSFVYIALVPIIYESLNKKKFSVFFLLYIAFAPFVGLSKGSFTILLVVGLLMMILLEYRSKARFFYSFILLLSFVLAGLFANHLPQDLISYIFSIFAISESYSQVFSQEGNLVFYVLYLLAVLGALLTVAKIEINKRASRVICFLIISSYAFVFALLIKTGFVRQDGEHVIRSIIALPIIFYSYLSVNKMVAVSSTRAGMRRRLVTRGINIVGLIAITASTGLGLLSYESVFNGKIKRLEEQWIGLKDVFIGQANIIKSQYASAEYEFDLVNFPTTNYTLMVSFITPILKSGISDFNVVPGVTSYMNSSDYISSKNAAFLSNSGAQNLLYQDNDLAPLSAAFLSLNANYLYVEEISKDFSLYKRRKKEIGHKVVCADKIIFNWGEEFTVPQHNSDYTFVKVFYERSIIDRMLNIIFKPIPVFFEKSSFQDNIKFIEKFPIESKLAAKGFIIAGSVARKENSSKMLARRLVYATSISMIAGRKESILKNIWNSKLFLKSDPMLQFCQLNFNAK